VKKQERTRRDLQITTHKMKSKVSTKISKNKEKGDKVFKWLERKSLRNYLLKQCTPCQRKSVSLSYYITFLNFLIWKLVNYSIFHAAQFSIDGQALLNG